MILLSSVKAIRKVLSLRTYRMLFGAVTVVFLLAYLLIPIFLVPGNSLSLQFFVLRPLDYVLFFVMSVVTALLVVMQVYVHRNTKKKRTLAALGEGGVSVYSALFAGLLATAACSSCIIGLVGFLGVGSTFFILEYQTYFVLGAMLIVVVALFFAARRVNNDCSSCNVALTHKK